MIAPTTTDVTRAVDRLDAFTTGREASAPRDYTVDDARVSVARNLAHVNYPHEAGYLYDCAACEASCHCTPGNAECVYDGPHNGTGVES